MSLSKMSKSQNSETKLDETKCSICLDDENSENIIMTPCKHIFHLECLKQLTRPKCPLCNKNIIKFLVKNGVRKKKIFMKIKSDDFRIAHDTFISSRTLDEMDSDDIMMTAVLAKNKAGEGWKDIYSEILIDIINHSSKEFCELATLKNKGFLIIHCDLSTLITNIIDGYTQSLLQWRSYDDDYNDIIPKPVMRVFKKEQTSLIIIINDDIDNDFLFIKQKIITECTTPLPEYQTIMERMCDCKYGKNTTNLIGTSEKEWLTKELAKAKANRGDKFVLYDKPYKSILDIFTNEIEALFTGNTTKCYITMIHQETVFRYILFKDDELKFTYALPNNKIIGKTSTVAKYLERQKLKFIMPTTLIYIEKSGIKRYCQLVFTFYEGLSIRRMTPEAYRNYVETDRDTGKKLLGEHDAEYI